MFKQNWHLHGWVVATQLLQRCFEVQAQSAANAEGQDLREHTRGGFGQVVSVAASALLFRIYPS